MDTIRGREDIVHFLSGQQTGIAVRSMAWKGVFRRRILAFFAMRQKLFSFPEYCRLWLPASYNSKNKLMSRYDAFYNQELDRELSAIVLDGCVNLFGHPFRTSNTADFINLVNDIALHDQYQVKRFLKDDSIVIDAGANVGVFSVFATQYVPHGHIYAFEPTHEAFAILSENTKEYPNISCAAIGLGDTRAARDILVDEESLGGSVFVDSAFYAAAEASIAQAENIRGKKRLRETIDIVTIDDVVKEKGIPRVDFIKIDTEGYEANILMGARETIEKWKPVIAMSAYHNANDKVELPLLLKSICPDYVCELHKDGEEDLVCFVKNA